MSIKNFIQHHKNLNESAIMEATVSELRMMGEDQDEILDAITFINKGIGKGNQKVKLPFGTDTLDALEKDSHRDGSTYILDVKANRPGSGYVDTVNDFLGDHGFECRLMDGSNYKLAAQEIVELAKALIKESKEQLSMRKETLRAAKVTSEVELSNLYYSLIEILGEFYAGGLSKFKTQAKSIMLKKYKLYMTDEYGFKMNEATTHMKHIKLYEAFLNEARLTDMEDELLKEIEKLGFTADGSASPAGRTIYGAKDYDNGRVSIYINTTSANHRDDSVIEVEIYFVPLYFVKRFFGLKKEKGLDMTKMKSLLPGKQKSQIIDLGTGLFDRSPEDNIKDIVKLIKDADKEYNKEYQNYQPEVNEAELNEAVKVELSDGKASLKRGDRLVLTADAKAQYSKTNKTFGPVMDDEFEFDSLAGGALRVKASNGDTFILDGSRFTKA